jgi:hypothetical protein
MDNPYLRYRSTKIEADRSGAVSPCPLPVCTRILHGMYFIASPEAAC